MARGIHVLQESQFRDKHKAAATLTFHPQPLKSDLFLIKLIWMYKERIENIVEVSHPYQLNAYNIQVWQGLVVR